jgi:hypothetical protein
MEKINLNEYLAANEYPGRGIAVAKAPDGRQMFIGYFIMGHIFTHPRIQIITATPMVHRREEANCRFWYASSRQRNKAEHHEIPAVDRRTTIPDRLPS